MKLYSKPGACSTADHIALEWSEQPYEVEIVTAQQMKEPAFLRLNPVGSVPVLVDGDFVLTQNAAILGYIADSFPQAGLMGNGTKQQRAMATRWLAYCNSDVHPAFTPLFAPGKFIDDPALHGHVQTMARARLRSIFAFADSQLAAAGEWIAGFRSVADAYLYITLRWANAVEVDLSGYGDLVRYKQRLDADQGVLAALGAERLNVV